MDTLDVARVCLRRWYLFLPVFLIAVVIGFNIKMTAPPMWVASGKLTIIYQQKHMLAAGATSPQVLNPLSANNGAQLEAALIADLNSADEQKALGSPLTTAAVPGSTASGSFLVEQDPSSLLINVAAGSADPKIATDVVKRVMSEAAVRADKIQKRAGAPDNSLMETFIAVPTQLAEHTSSGTKLLLAAGGTGALLGAALSIIGDRLLTRRASRRRARRRDRSKREDADPGTAATHHFSDLAPENAGELAPDASDDDSFADVHRHKAPSV